MVLPGAGGGFVGSYSRYGIRLRSQFWAPLCTRRAAGFIVTELILFNIFQGINDCGALILGSSGALPSYTCRRDSQHKQAFQAIHDASDPNRSGIYLNDGRLTLSKISTHSFRHADLAFLSAR